MAAVVKQQLTMEQFSWIANLRVGEIWAFKSNKMEAI